MAEDRCRSLISPLNCAAYLTWSAIFVGLELGAFADQGAADVRRQVGVAVLMLVFLAAFLFDMWPTRTPRTPSVLATLAVEVAAALALVALTRDGSAPVLLIIVVAQAIELPRAWLIALVAIANIALLAILVGIWRAQSALVVFWTYLGFQAFAGLTGHYARQAESSRDELAAVNAHLLATRSLLEESARDRERLRLARELHDVAGHKLTALKLQLAALAPRPPGDRPPVVLRAATLAEELLDDMRGVVGQMRIDEGLDLRRRSGTRRADAATEGAPRHRR